MPRISLILFDDRVARDWQPFALTRPVGELLFGALTLRARAERALDAECVGHLCAEHLQGFTEHDAPSVLRRGEEGTDSDRVYLLSRAVPELGATPEISGAAGPISIGGQVVGWFAPSGAPPPTDGFLRVPDGASGPGALELPGRVLDHVWDLIGANADRISADAAALHPGALTPDLPPGVFHWGEHPVILEEDVSLEPGCALDTSPGPIWLARGAGVRAFTRLAGPAFVGPGTQLLGGSIAAISAGPVCKLRGELSDTVCLGYTNKQHDGHMGHSYLGRWVNLGAETTNSDLKNNYGTIRMWTPSGDVDTGTIKLGCLLGDHVKTGIGLLLNTGTVVGAGSNLYGAAMPPKYVPPFSWGTGEELIEYRLDKFLEVADVAMGRRGIELREPAREQLRRAWESTREERRTGSGTEG